MKTIVIILSIFACCYLLLVVAMFVFQRNLLFYPVPYQSGITRDEISFHNDGLNLHGWLLNPGQNKAVIYFGGNSEAIESNIPAFESVLGNYSVYLVHYRGYGKSEGNPSEAAFFSDALAIYDSISDQYQSVSIVGRSLGSGVAVYLASKRETEKLVLLTPYDSIAEVAQHHYPFLPAKYIATDRFESFKYAPLVSAPILMVTAEFDLVVPVKHALKLREFFAAEQVQYQMINGAAHNSVNEFSEYQRLLANFVAAPS